MNERTVNGDIIDMELRQMNATRITYLRSHMYFVDFELDNGMNVSYIFNITKSNKYHLQRTKPYAMRQGKYGSTLEIVKFIRADLQKFKNACNSSNFEKFITMSQQGLEITSSLENMFLNYNVPKADMEELHEDISKVLQKVQDIMGKSQQIELKK